MYSLNSTSKERWLFISGDDSFDEPDEFVALIKEYHLQLGGEIIAVSNDTQYSISNDPLKLIFQWDTLFGITVIVPYNTDISTAEKTIHQLCDKLNKKQNTKNGSADN